MIAERLIDCPTCGAAAWFNDGEDPACNGCGRALTSADIAKAAGPIGLANMRGVPEDEFAFAVGLACAQGAGYLGRDPDAAAACAAGWGGSVKVCAKCHAIIVEPQLINGEPEVCVECADVPSCAATMGCLCAFHAAGGDAAIGCDATEAPRCGNCARLLDEDGACRAGCGPRDADGAIADEFGGRGEFSFDDNDDDDDDAGYGSAMVTVTSVTGRPISIAKLLDNARTDAATIEEDDGDLGIVAMAEVAQGLAGAFLALDQRLVAAEGLP
ncbi:MAG TPA: hypothetical protein VF183_13460, partial [Acidimicrobiales bacterium]